MRPVRRCVFRVRKWWAGVGMPAELALQLAEVNWFTLLWVSLLGVGLGLKPRGIAALLAFGLIGWVHLIGLVVTGMLVGAGVMIGIYLLGTVWRYVRRWALDAFSDDVAGGGAQVAPPVQGVPVPNAVVSPVSVTFHEE
jgi:hypothetical protein